MKIYTKKGDLGSTSLISGKKVSKSNIRIDAFGSVDELNSWIGVLSDYTINKNHQPLLREIQDRLFIIGSNLANDPENKDVIKLPLLEEVDIEKLEISIDTMTDQLPPLTKFILPGGNKEISFAHVARTVCRRSERNVVHLSENEYVDPLIIKYLNRLSDYLFLLCRDMTKALGVEEVYWNPKKV